mgnify:FL=1
MGEGYPRPDRAIPPISPASVDMVWNDGMRFVQEYGQPPVDSRTGVVDDTFPGMQGYDFWNEDQPEVEDVGFPKGSLVAIYCVPRHIYNQTLTKYEPYEGQSGESYPYDPVPSTLVVRIDVPLDVPGLRGNPGSRVVMHRELGIEEDLRTGELRPFVIARVGYEGESEDDVPDPDKLTEKTILNLVRAIQANADHDPFNEQEAQNILVLLQKVRLKRFPEAPAQ